jgi:hypothetical protein
MPETWSSSALKTALATALRNILGAGSSLDIVDSQGRLLVRFALSTPPGTLSDAGSLSLSPLRQLPVASGVAAYGQLVDSAGAPHRRWSCVQSDAPVANALTLNSTIIVMGRYVEPGTLTIG